MKFFVPTLFMGCMSNVIVHHMIQEKIEHKFFEKLGIEDKATKFMLLTSGIFGMGGHQAEQMNPLIKMMSIMGDDISSNTKTMMLMMLQNQGTPLDLETMLPLMHLGDDDGFDFKSMFLLTSMMEKDCSHETDSQMNMLMPLLMMDDSDSTTDNLMMMLMMQTMGNSPVQMDQMMPFFLLQDKDDDASLLMMVMMNSMTGGLTTQSGFDSNFNLLLPLALKDCASGDSACEKQKKDMMIMLFAMQSKSPDTAMGPDMMLPMLLMDDSSNNEDLIFLMMMNQNHAGCVEPPQEPQNEPTETVFRTWRVNEDGTKTLISESAE